eukprot:scaffold120299_cov62-Phaeocystis_antarctica.AAC.4
MCISYTSRSLALVRSHSSVMPSRFAGSRLTAAAKAHAQMHQRLQEFVRHRDADLVVTRVARVPVARAGPGPARGRSVVGLGARLQRRGEQRKAIAREDAAEEDKGVVLLAILALQMLVQRRRVGGPDLLQVACAHALEARAGDVGARAACPSEHHQGLPGEAVTVARALEARPRRLQLRREPCGSHLCLTQCEAVTKVLATQVDVRVHHHAVDDLGGVEALHVAPQRITRLVPRLPVKASTSSLEARRRRVSAARMPHAEEEHGLGGDEAVDLRPPRSRQQRITRGGRRARSLLHLQQRRDLPLILEHGGRLRSSSRSSGGVERGDLGHLPEDQAHARGVAALRALLAHAVELARVLEGDTPHRGHSALGRGDKCGAERRRLAKQTDDDGAVVAVCGAHQLAVWAALHLRRRRCERGLRAREGISEGPRQHRGVLAWVTDDCEGELVRAACELHGLDVRVDHVASVAHARRAAVVEGADGAWAAPAIPRQGRSRRPQVAGRVPVVRLEDRAVGGVQVVDSDRDAAGPEELEARRGEQGVSSEHGGVAIVDGPSRARFRSGFLETSRRELKRNDDELKAVV